MRLVVLGANGRTGQHVVTHALQQGLQVTAVIRDAARRPEACHRNLRVAICDPCDAAALGPVLRGQDAVISTLGGRGPSRAATAVYPRSAEAILAAAADAGVQRVLVTSTALLFEDQPLKGRLLRRFVPHVVRSAARMEETLQRSGLTWTAARPGFLSDAETAAYRAEKGALPRAGHAVSRRALAAFLVAALNDPTTYRAAYGVARAA